MIHNYLVYHFIRLIFCGRFRRICKNITFFIKYIRGVDQLSPAWSCQLFWYSQQNVLTLFLKSMTRWIINKVLFFCRYFQHGIYCFILRVFANGLILNNLQWNVLILMSSLDYIKYILANGKLLMIINRTIRLSRNYNWR